jgi:hypothetical protein
VIAGDLQPHQAGDLQPRFAAAADYRVWPLLAADPLSVRPFGGVRQWRVSPGGA